MLRHPGIALILSAGVLIFLAIPALQLHTANQSVESLPQDVPSIETYNRIQEAFPGGGIPAQVVVTSDTGPTPQVKAGIAGMVARAKASPLFKPEPINIQTYPDPNVVAVSIPITGDGTDSRSYDAVNQLRDTIIPSTIGKCRIRART